MAEGYGVSAAGGNRTSEIDPEHRAANFHATPGGAGEALLGLYPLKKVWECACGDGALSKVFLASGAKVLSSDLYDRGYGKTGVDFMSVQKLPSEDCDIATNPPFNLATEFIRHAVLTLKAPRTFLLLKSTFWHAANRLDLWEECRPSWQLPLTFRLDFTGAGSPAMELTWFMWDRDDPVRECRTELLRDNGGRPVKVRKPRAKKVKEDWDIV